jgi:hypothetical protein
MAQEDWGAAEPVHRLITRATDLYNRASQPLRNPLRKPDTSWHDDMVRKATESHRVQAERDAAVERAAAARRAARQTANTRRPAARTTARPAARPATRKSTPRATATRGTSR